MSNNTNFCHHFDNEMTGRGTLAKSDRNGGISDPFAESRKHYGRTVIDRRKVGKTMEILRKVCQNRDLKEGLDTYFDNKK